MRFSLLQSGLLLLLLSSPLPVLATTFMWEPQLYFSETDSPFVRGIDAGTIYLENFEDQALNTPFVEEPTSGVGFFGSTIRARFPSVQTGAVFSVDGDDGAIDGNGFAGDTWITISNGGLGLFNRAQFNFLPDSSGRYPNFVGIVVAEVEDVDRDVEFAANGLDGTNLFSDAEFDPLEWRPPGGAGPGSPLTQRFIGFYAEEGITSLLVSNIGQLDHLQYGYAIPEPNAAMVLLTCFGSSLLLRRRARSCVSMKP